MVCRSLILAFLIPAGTPTQPRLEAEYALPGQSRSWWRRGGELLTQGSGGYRHVLDSFVPRFISPGRHTSSFATAQMLRTGLPAASHRQPSRPRYDKPGVTLFETPIPTVSHLDPSAPSLIHLPSFISALRFRTERRKRMRANSWGKLPKVVFEARISFSSATRERPQFLI